MGRELLYFLSQLRCVVPSWVSGVARDFGSAPFYAQAAGVRWIWIGAPGLLLGSSRNVSKSSGGDATVGQRVYHHIRSRQEMQSTRHFSKVVTCRTSD